MDYFRLERASYAIKLSKKVPHFLCLSVCLSLSGEVRIISWEWCQSGWKIHTGQSESDQKITGASAAAASPAAARLWREGRLSSQFLQLHSSVLPVLVGPAAGRTNWRRRRPGVWGAAWSGSARQATACFQWHNPESNRYKMHPLS